MTGRPRVTPASAQAGPGTDQITLTTTCRSSPSRTRLRRPPGPLVGPGAGHARALRGTHVRQVKAMQAMAATAVVLMNVSGADPIGTIRLYGEHVLPRLRS